MLRFCTLLGAVIAGAAVPLLPAAPVARAAPGTDESGFVDSAARCLWGQRAAAIGRTQRSEVVVCATGAGGYEYIGVRVSDGATTRAAARPTGAGFVAQTDGASYTVSPTRLEVFADGRMIYGDTWIDYRTVD